MFLFILLAAQHVQQVVFTHRLGQHQASVLAARVVEVRLVKNSMYILYIKRPSAVFDRRCSLTGMIDIRHQSARQYVVMYILYIQLLNQKLYRHAPEAVYICPIEARTLFYSFS
jgi:hypothetical protein